jgi:amidase
VHDRLNAFCPHGEPRIPGAAQGPLAGLRFAAKDLFDVAGLRTGAGNPHWLASHPPAAAHAPVVAALLAAGASLEGKTITDELAFSLFGRNAHYGTPLNSAAPECVPGGSSSGSAAAVAGKAVDFAIGTDTGGSVRIPASFCGIFGMRPTHGRISLDGVVPLAPSFDAVGWFAREAKLLERVGKVLLNDAALPPVPRRLLRAEDAFAAADRGVVEAVMPLLDRLTKLMRGIEAVRVCPTALNDWFEVFRALQAREAWQCHGEWISRVRPMLAPDVQDRFDYASRVTDADVRRAQPRRARVIQHMAKLLAGDAVLALPTSPVGAPARDADAKVLGEARPRIVAFTAIAGLARLPQINIPAGRSGNAPVGLSLIAAQGRDGMLLRLAAALAERAER